MSKIQAIRGMNDLLPEQSPVWQYVERTVAGILRQYAFQEIRFPIVEQTELFKRSIGEVTDIVEKEMYTFEDRNGDSLTLRPEGTAGCVRACEQHGLLYNQVQRLWYVGPMFRHERPQKGRLRQFHQIGVEAFGMQGPDIDAELIIMTARLWRELGLLPYLTLELNTIGTLEVRNAYKQQLVSYLEARKDQLDEDSVRRLETNPLRILDSKNPQTQALLVDAPDLLDHLDEESLAHFDQLKQLLDRCGVGYTVNSRLVRGLDYYGRTVFEWTTTALGAQGTVCAGGRYDGLVSQLGGKATPAVGFAMGLERLCLLLEETGLLPESLKHHVDAYLVCAGDSAAMAAKTVAEQLRDAMPGLRLLSHNGAGNFKKQMKKANDSGATTALILGSDEVDNGSLTIKYLRDFAGQQGGEQETLPMAEAIARLQQVYAVS